MLQGDLSCSGDLVYVNTIKSQLGSDLACLSPACTLCQQWLPAAWQGTSYHQDSAVIAIHAPRPSPCSLGWPCCRGTVLAHGTRSSSVCSQENSNQLLQATGHPDPPARTGQDLSGILSLALTAVVLSFATVLVLRGPGV